MPDVGLLLQLAEIAGIFVGFGALISARGAESGDLHTLVYLRAVMWIGLWVLIVALIPGVVSRYGLVSHALWLPCSVLAVTLFIGMWAADALSPENKSERTMSPRPLNALYVALAAPLSGSILGSLAIVVTGLWPDMEYALYFTAVGAGTILAGITLYLLVFARKVSR